MDQVKATMESGFGAVGYSWLNYRVHLYEEDKISSRVYFRFRNSFNGQL
jgi:hypothetical protein